MFHFQVVTNLLISHVEIRWENSIDVSRYTHRKNIKTVVIPLGPELTAIKNRYIEIVDPYVRQLLDYGVINGSVSSLSKNLLIMKQLEFNQAAANGRSPNHSKIVALFSSTVALYFALEILERSGVQMFLNFFKDPDNSTERKYFVSQDIKLKLFLDELFEKYSESSPLNVSFRTMANGSVPKYDKQFDFGHPKYEILRDKLVEYFNNGNEDSKVIVFCELRESTVLVHTMLSQSQPLIKPRILVGKHFL